MTIQLYSYLSSSNGGGYDGIVTARPASRSTRDSMRSRNSSEIGRPRLHRDPPLLGILSERPIQVWALHRANY